MVAKLFIENIFQEGNSSPSSVRITMPDNRTQSNIGNIDLTGLMIGDPSFTAQNKWGTILDDFSNLQDVSSLSGWGSQFSWINASTMCWKGTAPLNLSIEFYLINYKRGLNLEDQLKRLIKSQK